MTPSIKAEIKLRQRAYTRGNMAQYNLLCGKVDDMIRKAKSNYYQTRLNRSAHVTLQSGIKPFMTCLE